MIPASLHGWSLTTLTGIVEQGVFETDRFDFKVALAPDENGRRRLRRNIAAFANAPGGFLVFGVRDERDLTAADRIVGIDAKFDFPQQFGAQAARIEPGVEWTPLNPGIALANGGFVHVVEIARSNRRPHGVVEDERWWFPIRTNGGTTQMTLDQIRGAVLDVDRRQTDFAWLRSEVDRIRRLAERLNVTAHHDGDRIQLAASRYDARPLRAVLARVFAAIACHEVLVGELNQLIERCEVSDAALAPLIVFEVLPKDRSYSGGSRGTTDLVKEFASQIAINAGLVMNQLARAAL
jgi:Putative DNA-binding domain